METITGPHRGFYVAAYAGRSGNGCSFTSYAKVCVRKPGSYWDAPCVFKVFGGEHHDSERSALSAAQCVAADQISRMPGVEVARLGFPMVNEAREIVFPLAQAILARSAR